MRYKKVVNGATTNYYYSGTQLLMEDRGGGADRIYYIYGASGISGMILQEGYAQYTYYFDKNTLGDIIAIRNSNGDVVARYTYDAWGNHKVYGKNGAVDRSKTSIGNINPFRYRGYYYDTETGFYYLQTRYYDPTICRFINADDYELVADLASSMQLNMYAYCGNNPIMYTDPTGYIPEWLQGLAIGLAVVGGVLVVGAITVLTMGVGTTVMATTMAGAVLHGAAVGTLIGAGVGVVAGGVIGGAVSDWSAEGILTGMGIGFGGGAIIGAVIGGSIGAINYTNAVSRWGAAGGRTPKKNMIQHFNKHVVEEGHSYLGKNVIQYTKNANNFFKANNSLMKITGSGNYVIRASFAGYKAGGFYNASGLIFSFF